MSSVGREEALQSPSGREERILVSVRLRPLNDKELARHDVADWECINNTTIIYRNNLSASDRSLYPTSYSFDRVFRPDGSTRLVYEQGAKEVALSVVGGINSSIFAYGQTSSGKTYTMSGIVEYSVADIFDYIEKHTERDFVLKFSAIEIYNESVRDLLSSDYTPLRLLDDPERGTVVEKLTEETLSDWNHFEELISFCETQRQIGETSLNEASSRSHQILRLTIESSAREFLGNDKSSSLAASVNFVDLAGSERASQTNSAGTRLKEGCHINRSLLTLGTVIRKLSKGRNGHIPFRDSKLTRILQSSLGGNARTAIICTLSPARSHVEQSRNTLLFASCAKEVSTNAQVNVVMSDKTLVKQLQKEVARLESELRSSGPARPTVDTAALLREKDLQIEMLMKEVKELTMQRDLAQSQIKDMIQMVGDDISSLIEVESLELDPQYPKIRVRSPWDIDNQIDDPNVFSLDCEESVRSFDASQFYDGNSFSSDENLFQLPDLERNIPVRISSPELSVTSVDAVSNDVDMQNLERNLPVRISSPGLSVTSVDAVSNDVDQKNLERNLPVRISSPGLSVTSVHAISDDVDQKNLERNLPVRISSPGLSVTSVDTVSNDVDQKNLERKNLERNLPVRISSPRLSVTSVDAESIGEDPKNLGMNLPVRISSPGLSVASVDAVSNDVDQKNLERNLPVRIYSSRLSVTSVDAVSIDEDPNNLERNLPVRISSPGLSVTNVDVVSNDVDQKNLDKDLPVRIYSPRLSVTSFDAASIDEDPKNLERNLPVRISAPGLSVTSVDAVSNDMDKKHDEDQQEDGHCKEVRHIESEDLITNTQTHFNSIDSRSNTYGDSNASSQGANTTISELTEVDNEDKRSVDFCSPWLKEDKRVVHFHQYFVLPSPEKNSPCITENSTSSSRTLKLSRSRSCKACLLRNSYSDWFDENEIIQYTPPIGNEKDFTGRPESLLRKVCTLNYKSNAGLLPCDGYENSAESSAVVEVQNVESPMDKETESNGSLAPKIEGNENLRSFNSLAGHEVPETEKDPSMSAKNFKDVGLDPMRADGESHSDWPSEFKRLQREIIELWDSCNVSLVHRTYFFLLFKGDPSDSIYMEVELRRLSFLKQIFSQGNQTLVDGRTLNPESSMRYLRRERQMLSKHMLKRLSKSDRENLYLKWGIQLSSKNRRLQLAHRLWSDTEDIEHITESAAVVAKLVGSVEPDQAMKEMFGLNFAPQPTSRKSLGWTASMKSIL